MILWQYVIVDLSIILLGCFLLPELFSTCCISLSKFPVLFWKSMSNVYFWCFHNVFLLVIEEASCSYYFFLVILILTTYLNICFFIYPLCMSPLSCFRDLHLSGRNNSLRVMYRVQRETSNSSTRSAYVHFTIILLSQTVQSSHSVHD